MTRLAVIAAMPGELKPLVRGWSRERRGGLDLWSSRRDGGEWTAACAGAGTGAAARAFAEIEKRGPVDALVSVGWAGALDEAFIPGSAYRVSAVIDAGNGERFQALGGQEGCLLVTNPRIADGREKRRLAAAHGAGLVDMEAAGLARLARTRGIPFYCVKGVSDGFHERLPDLNRFLSPTGRFRLIPFVFFALPRPWLWPPLARMGGHSEKAARNIAAAFSEIHPAPAARP